MQNECPLTSAVAVVTGGSRGIGAAISRRLAALGASVAVLYRTDLDAARTFVAGLEAEGMQGLAIEADVSDAASVDRAFTEVEGTLGAVTVLVNNAGVHRGGRVGTLAVEDWDAVVGTNLRGPFLCCRRAVPAMAERRSGRIVNVSSVVGINGFPGDSAYAAAKAGVIGLTKSLALELADAGIGVNALVPGFIDTDMTRGLERRVLDRVVDGIPVRRQGTSEEVAEAAAFLVAGPAYLTGSTLILDGGWTIA